MIHRLKNCLGAFYTYILTGSLDVDINGIKISINMDGDLKISGGRFMELDSALMFINCSNPEAVELKKEEYLENGSLSFDFPMPTVKKSKCSGDCKK